MGTVERRGIVVVVNGYCAAAGSQRCPGALHSLFSLVIFGNRVAGRALRPGDRDKPARIDQPGVGNVGSLGFRRRNGNAHPASPLGRFVKLLHEVGVELEGRKEEADQDRGGGELAAPGAGLGIELDPETGRSMDPRREDAPCNQVQRFAGDGMCLGAAGHAGHYGRSIAVLSRRPGLCPANLAGDSCCNTVVLRELDIRDFKLLHGIQCQFDQGMVAITGETGVGKSMLLGAVQFLFGAKAGEDVFAHGVDEVAVSGVFELDPSRPEVRAVIEAGYWDPAEDEEFVLERRLAKGGRSRGFLNGRRLTAKSSQHIGELLCDVLGQNETRYITAIDPIRLLDQFGDAAHRDLLNQMGNAFKSLRESRQRLDVARSALQELAEKRDYLAFQSQELTGAGLEAGEEDKLDQELSRLAHVSELQELSMQASLLLSSGSESGSSAYDVLADAEAALDRLSRIDGEWKASLTELRGHMEALQETGGALQRYGEELEADPASQKHIESRISDLENLKRKYRRSYDELIVLRDEVVQQLDALEDSDANLEALEKEVESHKAAAAAIAAKLHASREALAGEVVASLKGHLADLNLGKARVEFTLSTNDKLAATGHDTAQLLLATNPREALQPVQNVASGGEVTRLAMAFKALQASTLSSSMLIVDEGDLGIGGDTAFTLGTKFQDLARHQQLLIVSHLPQVAAKARQHLAVRKDEPTGSITIEAVEGPSRIQELARMLGASSDPDSAMELAASYLESAA